MCIWAADVWDDEYEIELKIISVLDSVLLYWFLVIPVISNVRENLIPLCKDKPHLAKSVKHINQHFTIYN